MQSCILGHNRSTLGGVAVLLEVVILQAKEGGKSSVLGAGSVESRNDRWGKWLAQGKEGKAA